MASKIVIDDFFSDPHFIRESAFNMIWHDQKAKTILEEEQMQIDTLQ